MEPLSRPPRRTRQGGVRDYIESRPLPFKQLFGFEFFKRDGLVFVTVPDLRPEALWGDYDVMLIVKIRASDSGDRVILDSARSDFYPQDMVTMVSFLSQFPPGTRGIFHDDDPEILFEVDERGRIGPPRAG